VAQPERQCIGCGRRGPQDGFVRFKLEEKEGSARVVVDTGKDRKGRGAYLCKSQACLDRALRRRAFNRAFRATVEVEEASLRSAVSETGRKGQAEQETAGV
jgi:predicted RNA-binding protein YlxR (DUF448 family)